MIMYKLKHKATLFNKQKQLNKTNR